jgi:hypothetical protein
MFHSVDRIRRLPLTFADQSIVPSRRRSCAGKLGIHTCEEYMLYEDYIMHDGDGLADPPCSLLLECSINSLHQG